MVGIDIDDHHFVEFALVRLLSDVGFSFVLEALAPLDHEMAKEQMLGVLARAVAEANGTLHQMSVAITTASRAVAKPSKPN